MANNGHLILTRKTNERILLKDKDGHHIATIEVCEANFGRARIGIHADRSVVIVREEIDNELPRSSLVPQR